MYADESLVVANNSHIHDCKDIVALENCLVQIGSFEYFTQGEQVVFSKNGLSVIMPPAVDIGNFSIY